MTRHRSTALAAIAVLATLLALLISVGSVAPAGADDGDQAGSGKSGSGKKSAATVGIRTADAHGGDERGVFDYEILPRGVVKDWVAISNYRYQPITVRLFAKDAASTPTSPFAVQASAEQPKDLGSWISLKKNRVTIPPRTEIVVPFQVGVPHNATPGDHAGAIVVSLLAKEPKPQGGSIVVDHRVGMRVHLRVPGDLLPAIAVENIKVDWNGGSKALGRGDAEVTYLVRNTGNVTMNVTGALRLRRVLGMPSVEVKTAPVSELLPGGVAAVRQVVKYVLGTGPMKAEADLHGVPDDTALKAKKADMTKTMTFSAWPWLLVSIVTGLLLLLLAGGWFERRRRNLRKTRLEAEQIEERALEASAKHRMTVRLALAGALAVVTGALLVGPAAVPAQAAKGDIWKATVSKKGGATIEPFDIVTSGGCPKPATNIVGFGYGAGFPENGAVVVSNIDGPVTNERGFDVALVDNMPNIMATQAAPQALRGVYKFVIRCIEAEWPDRSYGEYVAAIRFTDPGHWVAMPPLTTKTGPVVQIPTSGPSGEPRSAGGAGAAGGTGNSGGSAGQGAKAGPAAESPQEVQKRVDEILHKSPEKGSGVDVRLLAGGIAIALLSMLVAFGRRLPGPWRRP